MIYTDLTSSLLSQHNFLLNLDLHATTTVDAVLNIVMPEYH